MMVDRRWMFGVLASCFLLGRGIAGEGPTWLSLGAPFRQANSGTIVNGDAEKKLPIYDKLIPEVYQFAHRGELHRGILGIVARPRWFTGVGEAKLPKDIPLLDQGTSLSFSIQPLSKGLLQFDLAIGSKERDLYFQIEHRRNDITPFLFSFAADGVAVEAPPESGSIFGGVTLMHVLWKKNETGSLSLKVDPKNILALIGDRKFSELSIVAAFCERRQENGTGSTVGWIEGLDHMPVLAGTIPPISVDESGTETPFPHRPVLIRSHAVKLGYYDGKWSLKKE